MPRSRCGFMLLTHFRLVATHVDSDSLLVQGSLAALHECIRADAEPLAAITAPIGYRTGLSGLAPITASAARGK